MTVLLINLLVETDEKLELFKTTFNDISYIFPECHVKIRGRLSLQCMEYIAGNYSGTLKTYQHLSETDWIQATLLMLSEVSSRSVFIYFEDHRLVSSKESLENSINFFEEQKLDYLCYSFYRASMLSKENLLPVRRAVIGDFSIFDFNKSSKELIEKISPGYYPFSLVSIVSVRYLKYLLALDNFKLKLFSSKLSGALSFLLKYPRNRRLINMVNKIMSYIGAGLCLYPPASPFNVEKMCFEIPLESSENFKYAISHRELFANYDDDNGSFGESLIKRGLYPFNSFANTLPQSKSINLSVFMSKGECYDATYYSHHHRIRRAPVIKVHVVHGAVTIQTQSASVTLHQGGVANVYSNAKPAIYALRDSELNINVFDEIF